MLIYLLFIMSYVLNFIILQKSLHMLQQNLYNENNRYLKWIFKNKTVIINLSFILIILSIVFLFKQDLIIYILFILTYLYSIYRLIAAKKLEQNKKPLVYTARIKRLLVTISLIYLLPLILVYFKKPELALLILNILVYFNFFVVFIAMLINTPVEKMVYNHFKRLATKKLASMNNLKVIGITGSYGKTSSKNILNTILGVKYLSLATERSINTLNGNLITINNQLSKFDEVYIVEMGAYVEGEITELAELVKPKYGIITKIGLAHLETFGSEEAILRTKMELLEFLPDDGVCILNADDPKQKEYRSRSKARVIWIAQTNEADFRAVNIKASHLGTEFEVMAKGESKKHKFTTKLLGAHNVYNILAAIALGKELGLSWEELAQGVRRIKATPHRLELKKLGIINQIDDAYNSNPSGAKAALDVLAMMDGKKVVVTPGMIELGEKEAFYNKDFGRQIADVADEVILIGRNQTKDIFDGLMEKEFPEEKIHILNDVKESFPLLLKLKDKREIYALYENDLPDTYTEGGK